MGACVIFTDFSGIQNEGETAMEESNEYQTMDARCGGIWRISTIRHNLHDGKPHIFELEFIQYQISNGVNDLNFGN